uniref:phosphatidylinositol-3,5-bisphosphate 3-phosphatase n=1 Tax=Marmota marmota marmota TaxID=9994 RepID=A0A8C5ZRU6_MARMA
FPRKQLIREDENLQVPFLELHGESTEYVGRAEDAIIALSNYRLHIKFKESLVNVPLQLIESVECRDIFQLHLTCKDCKVIRCQFSTFEQCQDWLNRLNNAIRSPAKIEDLFSFAYHAWCMEVYASEKEQHGDLCRPGEHVTSRFKNEVERMGFDMNNAWRISNINEKYNYPQELIVPAWITDKELESVASFRSWKCIPAVVYRKADGLVISRSFLVHSVRRSCFSETQVYLVFTHPPFLMSVDSSLSNASRAESLAIQPQKLLILDARSYAAAVANRAKGGGCECPGKVDVVFMGSFQSLRLLCTQTPDPGNWLSALESTKWLHHLSVLLKLALLVVHAVDCDQRPVLVHCSDGWDRTPQIVALAKLLLDPYYRTIEGFQVLVEMEWLDFGHKFTDQCGHGENSDDLNERCPVFLQWLDCVHQLQRQFPCSFEFNEAFLVKLVQHTYSCLFGTFLCNNAFKNLLYSSQSEVLYPVCHVRNLMLWSAVYLACPSPSTPVDDSCAPYPVPGTSPDDPPLSRLPKTRSFDNLTIACDSTVPLASRRSSDPSLNEKWQEHRRSLELSNLAGPGEEPSANTRVPRVLSCLWQLGWLRGRWRTFCKRPPKKREPAHRGSVEMPQIKEENRIATEGSAIVLYQEAELGVAILRSHPDSSLSLFSQGIPEEQGGPSVLSSSLQEPYRGEDSREVPLEQPPIEDIAENQEDAAPSIPVDVKVGYGTSLSSSLPPSQVPFETRGPNMDSSMDMLMEDNVKSESGPQVHRKPCLVITGRFSGKNVLPPALEPRPAERSLIEKPQGGSVVHRTSPGSTLSPTQAPCALPLAECKEGFVCNGAPETENKASEQPPALGTLQKNSTPNGHCANAEAGRSKDSLSRQLSVTSCNSWLHSHSGRPSAVSSPEHPSHNHLDDDGMPVYTDTIQQRLRQIESGHQQEAETLKKQVQELKSRLESQYLTGSLRFNGDFGDEVVNDPLVPDHLAAHCYACDSAFWLTSRKHHYRNCGNVFCSSCCNQKVPVPSQQLFEPSRVCKSCYSSLRPTSSSIDLEVDKPIAATSN